MKVLLVGNYENNRQQSMQRFSELMRQGLQATGHDVRLLRPPALLGHLRRSEAGLGKWIGYIDRFLLFPLLLRRQVRWAGVVHICDQANAIYVPHLRGKPHVITCHDMLAIRAALGEIAESPTGWTGRIYQRWILNNLRKAQMAICVSHQTQEEVVRLTRLETDRVTVVPNALNYPYRPMTLKETVPRLQSLGLNGTRPYFLHVGGNQWYKNRLGVLRIFAELIQRSGYETHRLVMAGKPWSSEMRRLARSLSLQDRVVELVEVSTENLRALYSRAHALLFPSLHEGFGWPIVEAQACGCPVITTNRAPMNEVSGMSAIYIDPADEPGAASTIASALAGRDYWRDAGLENATRFSKEAMIDGYLQCYRASMRTYPRLRADETAETLTQNH